MWSQIAPWPENIDLILSTYQKEMIETDSYLYIANNDRDDADSDEHNSKHIHPHFTGNGKGLYATMKRWRIWLLKGEKR